MKAKKLNLEGGRFLKEEDVATINNQDAKNLIIAIPAAKGKIFRDTVYQEIFSAKKWYKPVKETVNNILKKDNIMNIRFLSVNFEIEYGSRMHLFLQVIAPSSISDISPINNKK